MPATVGCLLAVLMLTAAPAFALSRHIATGSFAGEGSEEGQLLRPAGIAVHSSTSLTDPTANDVYVVDRGNERVERFSATGAFLSEFNGSATPAGEFSEPTAIALDNSTDPLDPSAGDVYVLDFGHDVVDKFSPTGTYLGQITEGAGGAPFGELEGIAVDPSGRLWVYQSDKEIDDYDDASANAFIASREMPFGVGPGLAVDSEDDLFVRRGEPFVAKLRADGTPLLNSIGSEQPSEATTAFAVDESSGLAYLFHPELTAISVFSSSEAEAQLVETFESQGTSESTGLAVDSATGTVYLADESAGTVAVFTTVEVPAVTTGEADGVTTAGTATLRGAVNPEGNAVTSCEFEYGTDTTYGLTAPCETSPGAGNSPVQVSAAVSGLTPGTVYHFRLVAADAEGSEHGADEMFTASAEPRIDETFATSVSADSASLGARIDPGGLETTYRFEVGTTTAYGITVPSTPGHTFAGLADVTVAVHVQGLMPATLYHYRLVASNTPGTEVAGADHTFVTAAAEASGALPDGRAWEMVSPPDKFGATLESIPREGGVIESSEAGSGLAYLATAPTEADPEGNQASEFMQVLAERAPGGGWSSRDMSTRRERPSAISVGTPTEYPYFSPDLSGSVVEQAGVDETLLSPQATERTPYLRDDTTGTLLPLVTSANVATGVRFGEASVQFVGATPDLRHVLLNSQIALTSIEAPEGGLYEWNDGQLQLISRLPSTEGGEAAQRVSLGRNGENAANAVSNDGSRIFWGGLGGAGQEHLYERDGETQQTIRLDAFQGGAPASEFHPPLFQDAASDGSEAFFIDAERLTGDSTSNPEEEGGNPPGDLYAYDAEDGKLIDLSIDPNSGESARVQGTILGADEAGTRVYFVAEGALTAGANARGETAQANADNLYTVAGEGSSWGAPQFIATLSPEDADDWGPDLGTLTARVSPDGEYLAFMSEQPLSGYDNHDAGSGALDQEVFLYHARTGKLVCASCNPNGARPHGLLDSGEFPGPLVHRDKAEPPHWRAANVPGWTRDNLVRSMYQSRYLSNAGRLFFDSSDALSPLDVNGTEDVYEYEPPGVGSCSVADTGFSASSEGCVALISSGASSEESAFLDASASGEDVFFLTSAQLSRSDVDAGLDVYDAHVCTGAEPCPPPAGGSPAAACASADKCRPSPPPAPVFAAPPTSAFAGLGNLDALGSLQHSTKPPTRAQKLAKALKACRKLARKKKRAACEASARRRFAAHRAKAKKHKPADAKHGGHR